MERGDRGEILRLRRIREAQTRESVDRLLKTILTVIGLGIMAFIVAIPVSATYSVMAEELGWEARFEYWFFVLALFSARVALGYIKNSVVLSE